MKKKWLQELIIAAIMVATVAGGMALNSITHVKYPLLRIGREAKIWIMGEDDTVFERAKEELPKYVDNEVRQLADNVGSTAVEVTKIELSDPESYRKSELYQLLDGLKLPTHDEAFQDEHYICRIEGKVTITDQAGQTHGGDCEFYAVYNTFDDTCRVQSSNLSIALAVYLEKIK